MSNVKIENVGQDEKNRIVEKFTQELKSSGYTFSLAKNIVLSSLKGWITRRKYKEKNFTNSKGLSLHKRKEKITE